MLTHTIEYTVGGHVQPTREYKGCISTALNSFRDQYVDGVITKITPRLWDDKHEFSVDVI